MPQLGRAQAEDWLGPPDVGPEASLERLVRRYLAGFGPASPRDIADWAGLPGRALTPVLQGSGLRRLRDKAGEELFDRPRAPLPPADTPAPVRFLPVWDATLLAHARRAAILPAGHQSKVFDTKTPHSVGTFLVDGAVAGSWRYEKGQVRLDPFGPLDRSTRRELRDEAERLSAFHG